MVGFFHRNRPVIAYLLLVAALIWSLNSIRAEGVHRREEIAKVTNQTLLASCNRGNDTRKLLRGIIRANLPTLKQALNDGTINQVQYERALAANRAAIVKLHDVDCQKSLRSLDHATASTNQLD